MKCPPSTANTVASIFKGKPALESQKKKSKKAENFTTI
jgi:hypothetical protein